MELKKNKKVVVAMSGGVDSSVAAALLLKEGYQVIGLTLKLWPKSLCGQKQPRSCCSLQDIEDARKVAQTLKIPFYVLNIEKEFEEEVIKTFCSSYAEGRTPNPCIICNQKIKFGLLLNKALQLGANYVATGHYAQVQFDKKIKRFTLKEGADKAKDQSYVLFGLNQKQLSHCLLPIGRYFKKDIRPMALKFGLKPHDKPDSQEICFVLNNNYHKLLKDRLGSQIKPGKIINKQGQILGEHQGICFYTIGQRKGLGALGKPMYVIEIGSKNNAIVVGEEKELKKKKFIVTGLNWLVNPLSKLTAETKIRYNHPKSKAIIKLIDHNSAEVTFLTAQSAITPGQAAVFYKKDRVIGGGWIEK